MHTKKARNLNTVGFLLRNFTKDTTGMKIIHHLERSV